MSYAYYFGHLGPTLYRYRTGGGERLDPDTGSWDRNTKVLEFVFMMGDDPYSGGMDGDAINVAQAKRLGTAMGWPDAVSGVEDPSARSEATDETIEEAARVLSRRGGRTL